METYTKMNLKSMGQPTMVILCRTEKFDFHPQRQQHLIRCDLYLSVEDKLWNGDQKEEKEREKSVLNESQREMEIIKIETKISKMTRRRNTGSTVKTLTNINKTIFSLYMSFQHKLIQKRIIDYKKINVLSTLFKIYSF